MKNKKDIRDYLKIDKNSKTGLSWVQDAGMRAKAGDEALTAIKSGGYYGGSFNYKNYNAHQIIMFLEHGKWSNNQLHIDHIDGNKLNNKVDNLRFVSATGNQRNANRKMNSNNTSGTPGLYSVFRSGKDRWRARYAGKDLYVGLNKDLAIKKLEEARVNDSQYIA
tara:strand:- start:46 stop:540 length:495 start_codon:yes stop_codon:yes gene_type:complete